MFRNSLRRCAIQAKCVASPSLLQSRTAIHFSRHLAVAKPAFSISSFVSCSRNYSTEAAVQDEPPAVPSDAENAELTMFKQLDSLGVHQNLIRAITSGLKYESMTPVQAKTIVPALKGTDIVAQAKTGTGKTIAFLLPLMQRMLQDDPSLATRGARRDANASDIRGIVLSPTRELAEQIAAEARQLCSQTGLVVQCATGGTDKRRMLMKTRREGCHLLVATPGRLNDLLQDPASRIRAPNLAAMVLDEADRMLDVGFEKELNDITQSLPDATENARQTMLVSATIPDNVIRLARSMVRPDDFEFVQTIPENESLTHDKIPQHIVTCGGWLNVFPSLFELIEREIEKTKDNPEARPFKAIVYFNTTSLVELATDLSRQMLGRSSSGTRCFSIQSKLTQQQRQRAADFFRRAKSGVLISSDVTARGMDFPDVTHVIQIDTPRDRESYIHRLGRTGRQGKEGEGWLILPQSSLRGARRMLRGLPINPSKSLESAETAVASGTTNRHHDELRSIYETTERHLLAQTYTSMFGVSANKETLASELNDWAMLGWGWSKPPIVHPRWAHNMGLAHIPGMNLGEREGHERNSDQRSGGYDRERSGRFGSRNESSSDPFDSMRANIRSTDAPPSRFGRHSGGRSDGRNGGRNDRRRTGSWVRRDRTGKDGDNSSW